MGIGEMLNIEEFELRLDNNVRAVGLEVPEMNKITMRENVLGVNDKLWPIIVMRGQLPHQSRHNCVCVSDELPGSPDGTASLTWTGLSLDVGLARVPRHLGAGAPPADTRSAEIRTLNEVLHHGLLVGAVHVRTVQPLSAGRGDASLGDRANVAFSGAAARVTLDDLDMLVGMGGVETNTMRLVGLLHAARADGSSGLHLGIVGVRHDGWCWLSGVLRETRQAPG